MRNQRAFKGHAQSGALGDVNGSANFIKVGNLFISCLNSIYPGNQIIRIPISRLFYTWYSTRF